MLKLFLKPSLTPLYFLISISLLVFHSNITFSEKPSLNLPLLSPIRSDSSACNVLVEHPILFSFRAFITVDNYILACLLIGSIPGSPTTLLALSIHHPISNAYTMPCT